MTVALMCVAVLLVPRSACTQDSLALLPLTGNGIDDADLQTVYLLLQSEIRQSGSYELIPESAVRPLMPADGCAEPACAIELGSTAGVGKVAYGSLNKLGEKIIYQYGLVDVASQQVLIADQMTAHRVEDLDQVVKRVALSVTQLTPADKTVEVGLVTKQESIEPSTRKATSTWGIEFGYLYPSHGYSGERSVFVWDFRSIYEFRHFAIDGLLGLRKGGSLNIGMLYLPSSKDVSPFIGAGLGYHAIDHPEADYWDPEHPYEQITEPESDGFEFLLKVGVIGFRTYDFRVIGTLEYSIVLNDYDDKGAVFTIGIMRAGKRLFGLF